jgi:(5-formylfuran-3-yl)methyl phosphate synthase
MTKLLVSVRSAAEAKIACAAGVDCLDVKDPSTGPLGRPADALARAIFAEAVPDHCEISVARGEWLGAPHSGFFSLETRLGYEKWGFANAAGSDWKPEWDRFVTDLQQPERLIPVAYADWQEVNAPAPEAFLDLRVAPRVFLIDTYQKDGRRLFDFLPPRQLEVFIRRIRDSGRAVALAGSITWQDLPQILEWAPDWLAVRGLVCADGLRAQAMERERVLKLRAAIQAGKSTALTGHAGTCAGNARST